MTEFQQQMRGALRTMTLAEAIEREGGE